MIYIYIYIYIYITFYVTNYNYGKYLTKIVYYTFCK